MAYEYKATENFEEEFNKSFFDGVKSFNLKEDIKGPALARVGRTRLRYVA